MSKLFWLSFCDENLPKGSQFLGVSIVEVTQEMADKALMELFLRFPMHQQGAEWMAAAITEAHRLGCNPGGQVASTEIDSDHGVPRGRLLSRTELEAHDAI